MDSVLVHTLMSPDGFIAGPDDDMSWVLQHAGDMPSAVVDEVIARTGAVLAGRRVYDVGRRVQRPDAPGLFGGRWSGPHFILTHTPPSDETHPSYIFLSGDIRDAMATARTAADGRSCSGQTSSISASRPTSSMRFSCTFSRSSSGTGSGYLVPRRFAPRSRQSTCRHPVKW